MKMKHTLVPTAAVLLALLLPAALLHAQGTSPDTRVSKAQIGAIETQAAVTRAELVRQRDWLKKNPMSTAALTRHGEFQSEFDRRAAAFDRSVAAWRADPSEAKQLELELLLRQYVGDATPQAGGAPRTLPWGAPRSNRRMPAETTTAWYKVFTRDLRVQLAQAGALTTVGGVRFTSLPEPTEAPQDADLAETPDVQLTPAIRAKAQELGGNPVAIYNWVRGNVQYLSTWGAMQGADATLRSLRGNAVDTTSLTIALLRASGIPARYQFGTVDVPAAMAMNWLGGLSHPEAAIDLLQQGGVAARGLSEAGQIKTLRMEHVWASAYVNWSPSRGAREGGAWLQPPQHANPNPALNAWTPLDTAFKQHRFSSGLDLRELAPFSAPAALDLAKQGATCSAASASGVDQAGLRAHHAQFKLRASQQLGAADQRVAQVLGSTTFDHLHQPLLPGTLAVASVAQNIPSAVLTPALRWKLHLGLWQGTEQILALDKILPDLEGQVLSLRFVPESLDDAGILSELLRPEAGGDAATGLPARIAAYLVKFKAQLWLGSQMVTEGGSFTLGQPLALRSLMQNPEGNAGGTESVVVAGETHVWAVQAQAQGSAAPAKVTERMERLRGDLNGAVVPPAGEQASQLLSGVAGAYLASLEGKSRLYQRVAGALETRLPGVVRASSRLESEEVFGLVTSVRPGGAALHADRLGSAVASRSAATATAYGRQSLERSSAQAHHLLNRLFGAGEGIAQSALSGLASAAAQRQTIWRADDATLAQVMAAIDGNSTVRSQVQQAVANGMQALVVQGSADLGGLPMDPLVLLNVRDGTAAYHAASRSSPAVQLTAQHPGLTGWLGLADAQATKVLVAPALQAGIEQLNTAQALLGDIDNQRWQTFAGQGDVLDGLYAARISESASTTDACDWLISTLASQLGHGLPGSSAVNGAPVIMSFPPASAQADEPYGYAVQAMDPDGDALVFALQGAPTGMSIGSTGVIQWARSVPGQFALTVQVSDGKAITEQRYNLSVGAAGAGLNVGVALNPGIANAGQLVTLSVAASSSSGTVTRSATMNGAPLALNDQGLATFAAPAAGTHPIVVTASDGKNVVTREVILTVRDAGDTALPAAVITSPHADAGLRGSIAITGTATDARFAYYRLVLRRVGESDSAWQEISRGLAPVANGTLGQLDTSRYENGLYQIGLFVVDVNGAQSSAAVTVEFIGNLKLGQFRLSFADVRAEATGLPLMLTRTYDSLKKDVMGDFGWGWTASGQDITIRKNMTLGLAWQVQVEQFQLCLRPVGKRRISISLPDGGLYRFDARNAVECSFGQTPQADVVFDALPGPLGGGSGGINAAGQLRVIDGALVLAQGGMLVDADTGAPWNPKDFELTTGEGFKYVLREGVGILSVTDPYGSRVSYGSAGYQHSANLAVTFTRDAQGRITRATDPNGKSLTYTYNVQGELGSVTDRDGKVTQFSYGTTSVANTGATSGNQDHRHLLTSITDPRGQVVMSNQFDEYGRLTGTADALGQSARQEFDATNFRQMVTDRRGNRSVYTFNGDGNITQAVNPLGQTTTFTFDANGNETSVTNALGEKTERTFDSLTGKQLTEKNPLGHTITTSYYTVGKVYQRLNPLVTRDARGHSTGYTYPDGQDKQPGATPRTIVEPLGRSTLVDLDIKGNLRNLDIAGELTNYGYDTQGRRIRESNALGQTTAYAYDANGNESRRTVSKSVNGQTVTFVTSRKYDPENRVVEETDPLGGRRITTYNAAGKVASHTDSLGRVTQYSYDGNARLAKTEHPDGTSEQTSYDAEGNSVTRTDRVGRTTRFTYDALNRLARTDHPDGSFEATEYDAAGRVTASIDRNQKRSTMAYDAAGRQIASVDPSGRRTEQTFDENGNRRSVTVDGRTTTYEYDALNRLTKTTWPDGSTHTAIYRPDNRKQSETDQRGVVTAFGYDLAGRLTSVTQSLGAAATATTTYGYDETGTKTTQLDALGRTTAWTVDGNGRITSRRIQDGSTEGSRYDAEGNRLNHSRFGGETLTFQYDLQNRLTAAIVPSGAGSNSPVPGASVAYAYTPSGQLRSQQEQGTTTLNGTQSYRYDGDDRLVEVKSPLGQINYQLDSNGNIVARSVLGAGTTTHEYDDAGRLITVTAHDGKRTHYTYDAAGRLVATERELNARDGQPQLLVTHQRYDGADRVIAIAEVRRIGATETLIAGQALIRSAGGTISKLETFRSGGFDSATGAFQGTPANSQTFEYDGNARLTRETRSNGNGIVDTRYEYDSAGNRISKTVTAAAGAEITTYSYDLADRLTQENTSLAVGGSRAVTYEWDGNGNLAARVEAGKVTLYRFDAQNRLIDLRTGSTKAEALAAEPSATYAYDASGNRVRKGGLQSSSYMIDSSHAYAQVALETKGGGSQAASTAYVRGLQLIRQVKVSGAATEDLFPLHGHLNTSLGAIDGNGDMVDQTQLDAFGDGDGPTSAKLAHQYAGEYWDQDAQLLYLRARWYDPKVGRFISADPFEGKQRDPRSLNRYAYAHSDAVHGTDPSGREFSLGAAMSAMSSIGVAVAVRVTLVASQYPRLTGIAGFLAGIFLPMELGPGSNLASSLGHASAMALQSGARHLSQTAREFAKNGNFIGQGDEFEKAVSAILRIGKNSKPAQGTLLDGRVITVIPDFYWGSRILEIKTSGGAINLKQAVGLAALAKEKGQELVYVFYRRPSESDMAKLFKAIEQEVGLGAAERVTINYLFH